jgi:CRISPR-associated protein Cas1
MIKRTLEISREAAHLAVRHRQLQLRRGEAVAASFPCEDLGVVVVEHPQSTYTHAALVELMAQDAVVVLCGPDHLPCGLVLPLADHNQVVSRIRLQVEVSVPTKKRVWQQLVRAKILAQAENLAPEGPTVRRLREFASTVRSGDPDNREAHAARAYWAAWLLQAPNGIEPEPFRRDPDGAGINALLNYGYAIVRAALARAIVAAGLHPALGLHHAHRANLFCLADDLIEPLRPLVDARVRELVFAGETELTQAVKADVLGLLTEEVRIGAVAGPLLVSLHRYVAGLVNVFEGTTRVLETPVRCNSAVTAACGS